MNLSALDIQIILPFQDYVCPRCNSGFIEELERTHVSDSDSSSDTEMEPFDMLNLITQEPPPIPGASAASTASSSVPGPRISQRLRHLNPRHSRRRSVHCMSFLCKVMIRRVFRCWYIQVGDLCIFWLISLLIPIFLTFVEPTFTDLPFDFLLMNSFFFLRI